MNKAIHTLLLRSLEEELSPEEKLRLEQALAQSEGLRKEKEELLAMRSILSSQEFRFAPFFAAKVMNRLDAETQKTVESWFTQVSFAYQRIGVPALAVLVFLLLFTFLTEQSMSIDVLTGTSDLTVDDLMTGVTSEF